MMTDEILTIPEYDVLGVLAQGENETQKILSAKSGHSVGSVNQCIKSLTEKGLIQNDTITEEGAAVLNEHCPANAVILAAGPGMRMVPVNHEFPKALIEVNGEPLIERTIKMLNEAGIKKIYIVVGFMKEQFEYLMDDYGVELIVNRDYVTKNNLHSLALAEKYISDTYIVPCDLWCSENPFRKHEFYSWYMLENRKNNESRIRVSRKGQIVQSKAEEGNAMIGISYICRNDAADFRAQLKSMDGNRKFDGSFWESVLFENAEYAPEVQARIVKEGEVIEINTYEQLRELDENSLNLKSEAIHVASCSLNVDVKEIENITVLKKGMTNRSFLFSCKGKKYIMRVPGEGTDLLINRKNEADNYKAVLGRGICDNVIYINPENGFKITEYLENSRVCDAESEDDLKLCMKKLREFHDLKLKVDHEFDLFGQIDFYESLWNGEPSIYRDYKTTKENVLSLKSFLEEHSRECCLTHIDAVCDNFLFHEGKVYLIDWEYSGMQDPDVDLAMFAIYSYYDKEQTDKLIDLYYEGKCSKYTRIKIYGYMAVCGLLWSNWCEYKRALGVEFGEYPLKQYRYAKEFYRLVRKELEADDENK